MLLNLNFENVKIFMQIRQVFSDPVTINDLFTKIHFSLTTVLLVATLIFPCLYHILYLIPPQESPLYLLSLGSYMILGQIAKSHASLYLSLSWSAVISTPCFSTALLMLHSFTASMVFISHFNHFLDDSRHGGAKVEFILHELNVFIVIHEPLS